MDSARQEVGNGAPEGTVVIAGEQTRGRGRMQRAWYTPRGNIALSIVLYPDVASLPYLVMIASLAVASSIESVAGLKAQIKWPNDILINGKKVCGILIENEMKGNRLIHSIVGIGINVKLHPAEPGGAELPATDLEAEAGEKISRVKVIRHLLTEFERLYLLLPEGEAIYKAWRGRLVTLGQRVLVKSSGDVIYGIAESVDRSGALMLRAPDGSLTRIIAGDVTPRHSS
jgi:BirA family biotin operon repressor/biotin-[acetyl-CoA-carboxylase] ligase